MSKRRREADDGAVAEAAELNTVFVDTNLGTHLAMLICRSDSVSDFKKKVAIEHKQCFPEISEIRVNSVKVKRMSNYYHLPDTMHVRSAFHGVKRNWFLSVDASNIPTCVSSSGVKTGMTDIDDGCRGFISDEKRNEILLLTFPDGAAVNNDVSDMIAEPMVLKPVENTTASPAKKKRKVRHTEDACRSYSLEDGNAMFRPNGKDEKPNIPDSIVKASGVRNDQYDVEGKLVSEGTSLPSMAGKTNLGSILHTRDMEQVGKGEMKKPDAETMRSEEKGVSLEHDNEVILPSDSKVGRDLAQKEASVMRDADTDSDAVMEPEISRCIKKKKKKKIRRSGGTNIENLGITEIHKGIAGSLDLPSPSGDHIPKGTEKEERIRLDEVNDVEMKLLDTSNHDAQEKVWEVNSKEADLVESQTERTLETVSVRNKMMTEEAKSSAGDSHADFPSPATEHSIMESNKANKDNENTRKKKRGRKSIGTNKENLGMTEIQNGIKGSLDLPSPSGDHVPEGTEKEERIRLNEVNDVEMKLLDASNHDAADLVESLKERTLKNVSVRNKMMTEKTKNSAGDSHADFPSPATEHSIMESNKLDKDNEKTRKKKRVRKSISTNKENLNMTEIQNGIKGSLDLPFPSGDHISKATGKDESISLNEGKDVEMKLLDASNHEQEKVWEVNRKEADLVESQTLEDVSVRNKMMTEKTQSFAGNGHAGFPTGETENTLMESNQADKDDENTENKYKKDGKKKRKQKHTASDVQENLPVKDQQVGIEALATKETSVFANSELEGRDVDTSQVPSRRSEEKVDEMHELDLSTDGLAENSGKGDEGINFKQYFVADQLQNKVDSSDNVRKATKSKKSSTKVKNNDVPSVNIPTKLQNSIKSFENKDTVRTKCDSAHNSDRDEMNPNSFKRSSKTATKEENERSVLGRNVSSYPSLDKSSSGSETLRNIRQNNRLLLGRNVSNMMLMKTPKKKIVLATSGGIFQDNSGESSGDENGTMHSDHRTINPSDSSSMSGDSEGESELSQNSSSNGSNDAKAKSTSKIDSPASMELSLDVIAKGTKTFKKAIQVAEVEYVPESQL